MPLHLLYRLCVRVCVCVRERERETERVGEREGGKSAGAHASGSRTVWEGEACVYDCSLYILKVHLYILTRVCISEVKFNTNDRLQHLSERERAHARAREHAARETWREEEVCVCVRVCM